MKLCSCHPKWNLPMLMCEYPFDDGRFWIECDFCGNKTDMLATEEIAEFKWDEFQHKRGKPDNDKDQFSSEAR